MMARPLLPALIALTLCAAAVAATAVLTMEIAHVGG